MKAAKLLNTLEIVQNSAVKAFVAVMLTSGAVLFCMALSGVVEAWR